MSVVLLVLLEIDLSSHRSIGLFILTIDPQYNVSSENIPTWILRNDLPGTIYMTFVLKFQQTASFLHVYFSCVAPRCPQNVYGLNLSVRKRITISIYAVENQLATEFFMEKRENFDINWQIIYFHFTHKNKKFPIYR